GPRPLLMAYLPRYTERHRRRHEVRPGVTGLAQVSGRNAIGWAEKFELDVEYVERASLALDLWILWRTVRAVVRREGISAASAATSSDGDADAAAGSRCITVSHRVCVPHGASGWKRTPSRSASASA